MPGDGVRNLHLGGAECVLGVFGLPLAFGRLAVYAASDPVPCSLEIVMRILNRKRLLFRAVLTGAVLGMLIGCGDSESPRAPSSADEAADSNATAERSATSVPPSQTDTDDATASVPGSVSFAVNGQEKTFTYLPAEKNIGMSVSTMVTARPSAESREEFTLMLMSFNVNQAEFPVTLELGLREAMEGGDPAAFASAPKPMMTYVSADGIDYTSYVEVTLDSFQDGVLSGRVADRELLPSDQDDAQAGPVMLTDLRFEVALQ